MNNDEAARTIASVVARATQDSAFRADLQADPVAVLSSNGVDVPEGMAVEVVIADASHVYLVVPSAELLGDELLAGASGGSTVGSAGTASSWATSTWPSTASSAGTAGSAQT